MLVEKKDITTKDDIKLMVDTFYDKVNQDEILSPVFNGFAKVNWEKHLPIMYAFWSTVLFGSGSYKGSPFAKHAPLPVEKIHFDRWLQLFDENVDEHFEGPMADSIKLRAKSIAFVFQCKIIGYTEEETVE